MKKLIVFVLFPLLLVSAFIFRHSIISVIQNEKPLTEITGISEKDVVTASEDREYSHTSVAKEDAGKLMELLGKIPDESDYYTSSNSWISKGPYGMKQPYKPWCYMSGRIIDIEYNSTLRFAAASGGLWQNILTPLSDKLNTLCVSSFASSPGNSDDIIAGTGEYSQSYGNGFWRTTNGGNNWFQISITPTPHFCFKIRYDPSNPNKVHAATDVGYLLSYDRGGTWAVRKTGVVTDFDLNGTEVYIGVLGEGIYKSTDGGWTFTFNTGNSSYGRTDISICSSNPGVIYANVVNINTNNTYHILKTTNSGTTWIDVKPGAPLIDIHWGQGYYNNCIGVSPTDANRVLAGGANLILTTNGGTNWVSAIDSTSYPNFEFYALHYDIHSILWKDGSRVYVGHDGGITTSPDGGLTWNTQVINQLPITQFKHFDVTADGALYAAGSRDNGIAYSSDGGTSWWYIQGGDGGGVALDRANPQKMIASVGLPFYLRRTTNTGISWTAVNTGYSNTYSGYNYPIYDLSTSGPHYVYADYYVYKSSNYGDTWTKVNSTAFPYVVNDIAVTKKFLGNSFIFASLDATDINHRIKYFDGTTWSERSAGIPANIKVRKVCFKPYTVGDPSYALINGYQPSNKVFKTTNWGTSWRNISGDLPDVSVVDLVSHPSDTSKLYIGTETGCFKTTNGGINWISWNNGIPKAVQVSHMKFIDSLSVNGKFYVAIATYGRGIYVREVTGDDPIYIGNLNTEIPSKFELRQNYPNPFNPSTTIEFLLPKSANVTLKIYDVTGKIVGDLIDNKFISAGSYRYDYNAGKLSSGVYFYRLTTDNFIETKRMVLVR